MTSTTAESATPLQVQRTQAKDCGRRVAPRARHQVGLGECVPVELRDPVHEASEQVGTRVRPTVEPFVLGGGVQAEVGAEVDDARRDTAEIVNATGGLAVRQTGEKHVALVQFAESAEAQPRGAAQVGVGTMRELAGQPFRRDLDDICIRVRREQPQQLAARVAGTSRDCDADHGRAASAT